MEVWSFIFLNGALVELAAGLYEGAFFAIIIANVGGLRSGSKRPQSGK